MGIDYTDVLVTTIGAVGSIGVAQVASETIASCFELPLDWTQRTYTNNSFEISFNVFGAVGKVDNQNMATLAKEAYKIFKVSQSIGINTGFGVGLIETSINFYRGWLGKGERPFAVDIVEGGLRGSAIGFAIGWFSQNQEFKGFQCASGAFIGFVSGMMCAFIGSIAGAVTHLLFTNKEVAVKC